MSSSSGRAFVHAAFLRLLRATDKKFLESFKMWCWRRMEKISWTDHVRNEEVLLRVNEHRNILHEIRKLKANWIGHILRRICLLKQVIEGNIKGEMEVARIRGRRRKKLLDDLKDRRGYSHLKEEALDRTMWRIWTCRQTEYWMNGRKTEEWKIRQVFKGSFMTEFKSAIYLETLRKFPDRFTRGSRCPVRDMNRVVTTPTCSNISSSLYFLLNVNSVSISFKCTVMGCGGHPTTDTITYKDRCHQLVHRSELHLIYNIFTNYIKIH